MRRTLDELPKTLAATYERILREIPEQNKHDAHLLLQCLAVAVRPLRVEALAEVLAVDFTARGIPKLDVDSRWVDQEQAVLLACSSLIVIVKEGDDWEDDWEDGVDSSSRFVQFSHFSVKEFLTSERLAEAKGDDASHYHIRPEPAHTVMAQACLAILFRLDNPISEKTIKGFPLAGYAVENFSKHVEFENVLTHITDAVDYFLDAEKPHAVTWLSGLETQYGRTTPFTLEEVEPPKIDPLYHVAELGFCGLLQRILSKRPQDIYAHSGDRTTVLHVAVQNGRTGALKLLLAHCVDVDIRGILSQTLLHIASRHGYEDIMQLLLDQGADVEAQDDTCSTPLHLASSQKNVEAVKVLIKCGANVQVRNNKGETPLHLASWEGYDNIMRLLLDGGAEVDARDDSHWTPLHRASSGWWLNAAELLIECGASVQVRNDKGETPLHLAVNDMCYDIMRLLLDRGAEVDAQDDSHSTALHLASFQQNAKAAKLLIECGANVQVRNNKGETPLDLASKGGYDDIMQLLLDRGAECGHAG